MKERDSHRERKKARGRNANVVFRHHACQREREREREREKERERERHRETQRETILPASLPLSHPKLDQTSALNF